MDLEVFEKLLIELSDIIKNFNSDLKKGILTSIIANSNEKINEFIVLDKDINNLVIFDPNYGINIEFTGLTGKFLFPSILYSNRLRVQILRDLKNFLLQENLSVEDISLFLSKKLILTLNTKKGGFSKSILETLRFCMLNFNTVMDNEFYKFEPYLNDYNPKYYKSGKLVIQKNFPLTQKFLSYSILANFHNFGLKATFFNKESPEDVNFKEINGTLLGSIFDNQKKIKFLLLFTDYNSKLKNNFIEKIYFYENFDLFHKSRKQKRLSINVNNILNLYYDYKDSKFTDTSISSECNFYNKKKFSNRITDLDVLINLYNTRSFPLYHYIHPISRHLFSYRNKLINFYGTKNYFIYIYEPEGKSITTNKDLIVKLIKNTFSNGFVIQNKTSFLISTHIFQKEFEKQKDSFLEFFFAFKLGVKIYENLNFIPFSFYQIPSSVYLNNTENVWNFPLFKEKQISQMTNFQIENLKLEKSRLLDIDFKNRTKNYLSNWIEEIHLLQESFQNL